MPPKNNLPTLEEARRQMAVLIAAYKPSASIQRIEIKIRPVDMIAWLALQKNGVKVYGANQSDTMSIAGIGQAASVTGKRVASFKKIFKELRSVLSVQYPYMQWYGGFCFDQQNLDNDWKEFGAFRFVLPRFELAAQEGRMIFCCNLKGRENNVQILKQLKALKMDVPARSQVREDFAIARRNDTPDQKLWRKGISTILSAAGVEKVVLARKTSLYFKKAANPWVMLRQLKAVTPNSYHFAFQFGKTLFLGASPERLFRRYQRAVESEALAGTMPRSAKPRQLRSSAKNKYEHQLVVDAIEDSFNKLCAGHIRDKAPSILTLPNGHHLITKFQGQLKDGVNDEDILESLHPTPALGGSPRTKAVELIRKLEGFSRGWYGAPVGYVGLDWAEFVVGIRSGLARARQLSVFAGAGIVQGSEPQAEWDEVENKISNFIKIIR